MYEDGIALSLSLSLLHPSFFYLLSSVLFTHDYFLRHLIYNSCILNLSSWNFTGSIYPSVGKVFCLSQLTTTSIHTLPFVFSQRIFLSSYHSSPLSFTPFLSCFRYQSDSYWAMEIHDHPTIPASPGLASNQADAQNKLSNEAQQVPTMAAPQVVLTTDIHSPLPPLSTHEEAAAVDVINSANCSSTTLPDTKVAGDRDSKRTITPGDPAMGELTAVSNTESENPFVGLESPGVNDTTPVVEVRMSHHSPGHEHDAEQDEELVNDGLMEPGSPSAYAESAVSDSDTHMSPDAEPVSSSVKGQPRGRSRKTTVDLDGLPNPDDELTDAEIASLFLQPRKIRQRYTPYFSGSTGFVRVAYQKLLFERLPDGGMRFSEDVLRSCLAKWKDRLEAFEIGESHPSTGVRKRKYTVRSGDDGIDATQKIKKKASATKDTKLPLGPQPSDSGLSSTGLPILHLRSPGSRRAAPAEASVSRRQQGESTDGQNNDLGGPSLDNRRPVLVGYLSQSQPGLASIHRDNGGIVGGSQLLDPVHRSGFIQYLTNEIHQLDYIVLNTAISSHNGPNYRLRILWDDLVQLRNSCVNLDVEQKRQGKTTQDRDETDKQ